MGLEEGGRKRVIALWYLVGSPSYANLRETIIALLKRKRTSLPTEPVEPTDPLSEEPAAVLAQETEALVNVIVAPRAKEESMLAPESQATPYKRDTAREKWFHMSRQEVVTHRQSSRAKREAIFKEVWELHEQGLSIRTIARSLGLSRQRVRRCLQVESLPERVPRTRSAVKGKLDPFVPYVLKRWNEGVFNGTQRYREIRDQGYTGSRPLLGLLIADLRRRLFPPEGSPRTWMRKGTPTTSPRMNIPKPPMRTPPQRQLTPRRFPGGICFLLST
jgi:hypothetical protein